jgi:hypothetical protein
MRAGWRFLAFVALLLFLSLMSFAATDKALVYGTVVDPNGKPLPGVRVVLTSDKLKFVKEAITDNDGGYTLTDVPPTDDYSLVAYRDKSPIDSLPKFELSVGDERLLMPPLREHPVETVIELPKSQTTGGTPGQPGEQKKASIEVKKIVVGAARINHDASMAISGVIKDDQLRGLPLFNRNFLALGLLTAQTHDVENGSPLAGATFSIAGSRPISNMFLLDGLDNVARSDNQAIPFQVNEAVQEFRVISATPNAEYGGQSGGVVNVITKRGTSAWHGTGFGYFSKDALNANSPLSVYNGSGFDSAAAYAGNAFNYSTITINPNTLANNQNQTFAFGPTSYNQYAFSALVTGWCTDSIRATAAAVNTAFPGGPAPIACNTGGFGRNTGLNVNSFRPLHDSFASPFDSKQYGYNMGGPIMKGKLFVFGSYEGTLIDNANPVFERVPSTFDRTYNPLLAAGSPTAVSSATGRYFSSSDANFLFANSVVKLFPTANVVAVPGALEFFQGEAPNYTHVHNGLLRLDTAKTSYGDWSFRYVAQALNQLHDNTFPSGGAYPGNGAVREAFNQSLVVSNSRSIGPNFIFDTRAGFTRFRVNEIPQDAKFSPQANGINLPTSQMMTMLLSGIDPQVSGASPATLGAAASWMDSFWDWTVPIFSPCGAAPCAPGTYQIYNINGQFPTLDGQFPMMRLGAPLSAPGQRRDTTVQADENVSFRHNRHLWKMGGGYRNFMNRSMNGGFNRGMMVSTNIGEFTSDSESSIFYNFNGLPGAFRAPSFDFALRQPQIYRAQLGSQSIGGYIQDSWRVSSRVTLNGGVRYDFFSTPQEDNNQLWNYDSKANGLVQQNSNVVVDPYGSTCASSVRWGAIYQDYGYTLPWACSPTGKFDLNSHRNGVAPRAGFAWDLRGNGDTMLRAGIGYMVDQVPSSTYAALGFNRPTPLDPRNPQLTYGRVFPNSLCFACALGNTTVNPSTSGFRPVYQAAASPMTISAIDPAHTDLPRTRQISVSVQQKLTSKTKLEVGYVGSHGMNLPTVFNSSYRNEFSCTTSCDNVVPVFTMANRGESTYHSLMARMNLLSIRGFSGNITYVYSKALDNVAGYTFPLSPVSLRNSVFAIASTALGAPGGNLAVGAGPGAGSVLQGQTGGLNSATGFSDALNAGLTTTGNRLALVSRYNIPQDPLNYLRDDYGLSDFNTSHRFVFDYAWDLPFLRGSGGKANVFGNWRVSAVISAQTGQPFTVFAGPIGGELTQRAHVVSTPNTSDNPNAFINASAFALPSSTTPQGSDSIYFWRGPNGQINADATCAHGFGQVAPSGSLQPAERNLFDPSHAVTPCIGFSRRNEFVGPGYASGDVAIQKSIQLGESKSLNFRAEFFNITNRANYYNPISELSLDGFNLNSDFGKIKSAKEPRQIQLAVRYTF